MGAQARQETVIPRSHAHADVHMRVRINTVSLTNMLTRVIANSLHTGIVRSMAGNDATDNASSHDKILHMGALRKKKEGKGWKNRWCELVVVPRLGPIVRHDH